MFHLRAVGDLMLDDVPQVRRIALGQGPQNFGVGFVGGKRLGVEPVEFSNLRAGSSW
ncbi:hypothetical protein AB0876_17915 [Mycobacterium sp. NPDC049093]